MSSYPCQPLPEPNGDITGLIQDEELQFLGAALPEILETPRLERITQDIF